MDATEATTTGEASAARGLIGYAEFGAWYDDHRTSVLDPALTAAAAALDEILSDTLSTRDLTRIRRSSGRIKSKRRAWRKIKRAMLDGNIASVDDIPDNIYDLVGVRITCTNLRDIDMVQAALDVLPTRTGTSTAPASKGLCLYSASERDYVHEPKESGYRGWHVNLSVTIDVDGQPTPVTCELQVRTLLQDSWGELTHEDTYSKDGALPPLVEVLSKRMADLFATLDDIAEDLRTELDRIDEAVAAESESGEQPTADVFTEQGEDAASLLIDRWSKLDRPIALSALAWELQREFGAEVADDWFGHGGLKRFLRHAVPDGEITTGRHAYLLPQGASAAEPHADDATADDADDADPAAEVVSGTTVPKAAEALRRTDQGFPLIESEQWSLLFAQLAEAWRRTGRIQPSGRAVNRLTRSARDRSHAMGTPISRRHLDYTAKSLLSIDGAGDPLDAEAMADAFTNLTLQRMTDLRILGERNRKGRAIVRRWLTGGN